MTAIQSPDSVSSKIPTFLDVEFATSVLNRHGTFFERWCQQIIQDKKSWKITATHYPVQFPWTETGRVGKDGDLDIRAEIESGGKILDLIIECKRNHRDYRNWVFFKRQGAVPTKSRPDVRMFWVQPRQTLEGFFHPQISLSSLKEWSLPVADEAREVKKSKDGDSGSGDESDQKTSNTTVQQAAFQTTLALQAILFEECFRHSEIGKNKGSFNRLFLPVIITTARIFLLDFDPAQVDPETGRIKPDKVNLTEQPYLLFEYPIPRSLDSRHLGAYLSPDKTVYWHQQSQWIRLPIVVIQSESVSGLLDELAENVSKYLP